jgi:hypothetical protein
MSLWETLLVLATFGQVVVVGAGAVFAYLQLRGLRRQQEAMLVTDIFATLNSADFAAALDFVYNDLGTRLMEPSYLAEVAEGRATAASHRELVVMHFFNGLGLLVHRKMVDDANIVFIIASPAIRAWKQLAPVIEQMRRTYPHAYTPFQSLVARARAIDLGAINARFQEETPELRTQWQSTAQDLVDRRLP